MFLVCFCSLRDAIVLLVKCFITCKFDLDFDVGICFICDVVFVVESVNAVRLLLT